MGVYAPDAARDRAKTVINKLYVIEPEAGKEEGNDQG